MVSADTLVVDTDSADTNTVDRDTVETQIRTGKKGGVPARIHQAAKPAARGPAHVKDDGHLLAPGARVGHYLIEEAHSSGGFATVYRATHEKLDRPVALKVLHAMLASTPNIVKRFEQEARAVNRIRHANIVDITDYGELPDGRPFFVMEWLSGPTLKQLVNERGALPARDALRICEDVVPALAAAHEHGIIHRDLKLSNVVGVPDSDWFRFKLLDFGIAKIIHPDGLTDGAMTTQTGNRVGSPLTMAPEQIRCQPVDGRTDIYALGVLLFELVTGKTPYRGSTAMEVEKLHLKAPVPIAAELAPVAGQVSAVIAKCMQKAKEDRYATVADVLAALQTAVAAAESSDQSIPEPAQYIAETQVIARRPQLTKWLALGGVSVVAVAAVLAVTLSSDDSQQASAHVDAGAEANEPKVDPQATPPEIDRKKPPTVKSHKAHKGKVTRLLGTLKPANFDVTASVTKAQTIAREQAADAVLIEIDADNVSADGTADLTMGKTAIVMYRFRSKDRSKKRETTDPDARVFCLYYVYADKTRFYHYPKDAHDCGAPLLGPPKCSVSQVWSKAQKRGATEDLQRATVRYKSVGVGKDRSRGTWIFSSGTKLELKLPDDCKK